MSTTVRRARLSGARHWQMLGLALAVPLAALALEVTADGSGVAFKAFPDWTLPEACLTRQLSEIGCPGCGLTRSIIHLVHGRLYESWAQHHLGWLIGLVLVAQAPYRLTAIRLGRDAPSGESFGRVCALVLIGLLAADWLWRAAIEWLV